MQPTMNKADQAFFKNIVDGDWVEFCDNLYELLTMLLLDARTPLKRVRKVAKGLKEQECLDFRTLHSMDTEFITALLKDLSYPWNRQKAKLFAQKLPFKSEQELFDATYEQIDAIKGIGPKLASLWMRIVHDEDRPVIDTHVYRWLTEERGYDVPLAKYDVLSELMRREAEMRNVSVQELDRILVSNGISKRQHLPMLPVPPISREASS